MGGAVAVRPVRILHLSDIHFRVANAWDAVPVLRALTKFVGEQVAADGPPDLVALTGDLAFSGLAEEYELARAWLEEMWSTFGNLPKDRLLLVPGNHDVDRNKVTKGVRMRQDALVNGRSQDDIAELLRDDDERASLLKRHAAYLAFAAGWFGEPQPVPWWRRRIEIGGVRLHIAGLDSAWMASGDRDRGQLLLGRWQIHEMLIAADPETVHWRLALLHHPWDYLAEFDHDEARYLVRLHCDLVLRGHRHKTDPAHTAHPNRNQCCIELAAGCIYETSQYPNAFQWIELSRLPKKHARVQFFLLRDGIWTIDRNIGADGILNINPLAPKDNTLKLFISYRRGEDSGISGRLFDYLERFLKPIELFMDVNSIDPGNDFTYAVNKSISECDILLAVIGRGWLAAANPAGRSRLDNPDDFVRVEIETALKMEKTVIPILIDDVIMPSDAQLPDAVKSLTRRHAARVNNDRFKDDSKRLIRAIKNNTRKS